MSQPSTSTPVSKEPGERSPTPSASHHHHHRKAATITKPNTHDSDNPPEDDQPEDLSIKSKADGDGQSQCPSSDGRLSSASCHQDSVNERVTTAHPDMAAESITGRESQLSNSNDERATLSPSGTEERCRDSLSEHSDTSHKKQPAKSAALSPGSASNEQIGNSSEQTELNDKVT